MNCAAASCRVSKPSLRTIANPFTPEGFYQGSSSGLAWIPAKDMRQCRTWESESVQRSKPRGLDPERLNKRPKAAFGNWQSSITRVGGQPIGRSVQPAVNERAVGAADPGRLADFFFAGAIY